MYIKFNKVYIEGFQSIKTANLDLDNQGIVQVKGVNNYENNADSNGSGKSSCFESIIWVIYGKTSMGITDPANKYLDKTCLVVLEFDIDNNHYKVIRSIRHKKYGTGIIIECNGNDISCRNKSETDKKLRDIIPFSYDIFLSTIFLSQGFNSRLSTLAPSGRKERIESLTGISEKVDEFKDSISSIKSKLNTMLQDYNNKISYIRGSRASIISNMTNIMNKLDNTKAHDDNFDELSNNLMDYKSKLENIINSKSKYDKELADISASIRIVESRINSNKNNIISLNNNIDKLHTNKCPTCNSIIGEDIVNELKFKYESEINDKTKELMADKREYNEISSKISNIKPIIENYSTELQNIRTIISNLEDKLSKYSDQSLINDLTESIKSLKLEIYEIDKNIEKYESELNNITEEFNIINHCLSLVSRPFRSYLLENIVKFVNSQLLVYSDLLFSNSDDKISLDTDSSKLNIYLGNSLYESLSGGEKRKVDIALTFAQRDLLLNVAGISTNLIILDEVMDHMDQSATSSTLNMISLISDHISSMFIISHNNYELPFDRIIEIVKDNNRCSVIKM